MDCVSASSSSAMFIEALLLLNLFNLSASSSFFVLSNILLVFLFIYRSLKKKMLNE